MTITENSLEAMSLNDFIKKTIYKSLSLVCEGEDASFSPFIYLYNDMKQLEIHVLHGVSNLDEISRGADISLKGRNDVLMYALVWDGRVTTENGKTDALFIEIAKKEMDQAVILLQPYKWDKNEFQAVATEVAFKNDNTINRITINNANSSHENEINTDKSNDGIRENLWLYNRAAGIIFFMIVRAEKSVNDFHVDAFVNLPKSNRLKSEVFKKILSAGMLVEFKEMFNDRDNESNDRHIKELELIKKNAYSDFGDVHADAFLRDLYSVGVEIAVSQKARTLLGAFGITSGISKNEKKVLKQIAEILDLKDVNA
jgi:hypothetical protein